MKETFNEYKKTLEKALINSPFLYSGDVDKLNKEILYSEDKDNEMLSPDFIIKSLVEVYKETIKGFFSKEYKTDIFSSVDFNKHWNIKNLNFRFALAPMVSYNKISDISLEQGNQLYLTTEKTKPFPDYFYPIGGLSLYTNSIKSHYSPQPGYYNVPEEIDGSYGFWMIDKPIQSLLWTIQNMEYQVDQVDNFWRHTMRLPVYDCQYDAIGIKIRDTQKFRENIISKMID